MSGSVPRSAKTRPLTIIAQDTAVLDQSAKPLLTTVNIPAEQLAPGPSGYRIRVIDYDASTGTLYEPENPAGDGYYIDHFADRDADELVQNPKFHQQNVYAIAMKILGNFEFALGRHVSWQFDTHQLKIVPHAFRQKNAFYARELEAILFGYYARKTSDPQNGSLENCFTCLSHDVVAHETTHALLDGVREGFVLPSLPDQAAFHEGFSDIIAILSVGSSPDLIQRIMSGGERAQSKGLTKSDQAISVSANYDHTDDNLSNIGQSLGPGMAIFTLAEDMGSKGAGVHGSGLRDSLNIKPSRDLLGQREFQEPHRRGELLVAAVLRSIIRIAERRCYVVGVQNSKEPEEKLISQRQLAECVAEACRNMMSICIRALDYLPPVHLTFGEYLSALLTADYELVGNDSKYGYRAIIQDSFESYGIVPAADSPDGIWGGSNLKSWIRLDRTDHHAMMFDRDEMFRFLWENRKALGISDDYYTMVTKVQPSVRIGPEGMLLSETIVEYVQSAKMTGTALTRCGFGRPRQLSANAQADLYGGGTLIFDIRGQLKYHIPQYIDNRERQTDLLRYVWEQGLVRANGQRINASFASLHELRTYCGNERPGWEESW